MWGRDRSWTYLHTMYKVVFLGQELKKKHGEVRNFEVISDKFNVDPNLWLSNKCRWIDRYGPRLCHCKLNSRAKRKLGLIKVYNRNYVYS
jgi:hypothetical protein